VSRIEKYDRLADGFSEREYADPAAYGEHCARVICESSPGLVAGSSVLDLACGDGLMAAPLGARGFAYAGVDASTRMVAAARARHPGARFLVARIEEFEPPEPVETTICLRTVYAVEERAAFFRRVAGYTRGSFVFDFRRAESPAHEPIFDDLRAAGFATIELRPSFLPQRHRFPPAAAPLLGAVEHAGPLAWLLARRFGRVFCTASA
jgi:SAM-dependent methyltransferase